MAVRAPRWRFARPGGNPRTVVAVCASWLRFTRPGGGWRSCGGCVPRWQLPRPGGRLHTWVVVAHPGACFRAKVAVRAPMWWFSRPRGASRALVAVRAPEVVVVAFDGKATQRSTILHIAISRAPETRRKMEALTLGMPKLIPCRTPRRMSGDMFIRAMWLLTKKTPRGATQTPPLQAI